jgi:hypothetical protein
MDECENSREKTTLYLNTEKKALCVYVRLTLRLSSFKKKPQGKRYFTPVSAKEGERSGSRWRRWERAQ